MAAEHSDGDRDGIPVGSAETAEREGGGGREQRRRGDKDKLLMILIVLKVQLLTDTLEQVPMLGQGARPGWVRAGPRDVVQWDAVFHKPPGIHINQLAAVLQQ